MADDPTLAPPVAPLPADEPPSPRSASWTDAAGGRWARRGDVPTVSRIRRLLTQPDVRVVHVTLEGVLDVPLGGREALRQRLEPYLKGAARAGGDHTEFFVGEFRDEAGGLMLVVEEHC